MSSSPKHNAAFGGLVLLLVLALVSWKAGAAEKKVTLAEVPEAARKVIQEHQGTAILGEIKSTVEDGETVYEAEAVKDGESYSLSVSADGKWYNIEIELSAAPLAVRKKARELAGNGTIDNVSKVLGEGAISYEVELTIKDRYHSYTVGPRGGVRSHSEELKLLELPEVVQKTVKQQLGQGKLGDIYRTEEDGEVYFSVETTRSGKDYNFSVAPSGKFLGVDE